MALMEGEHVGPFNLGNPGEFTMLELAEVRVPSTVLTFVSLFSDFRIDMNSKHPDLLETGRQGDGRLKCNNRIS